MIFFIFIIGLIFGSFYNVVGLRLPNNESIISPGSHCPKCNYKLSFWENIPLISFMILKGRCSNCKCKISYIYPLMELLTGILFMVSYLLFGFSEYFIYSIVLSSLIVIIFVSDSKYMIISDSPLVVSIIIIFVSKWIFNGYVAALKSLLYGLIIFLIVYSVMLIGNFIFKKESLGGGDIKLSFIAGMLLGPLLGVFYLVFAAFLAFPYAMYVTIKDKNVMLPFGPFLIVSMYMLFINMDIAISFIYALLGIK